MPCSRMGVMKTTTEFDSREQDGCRAALPLGRLLPQTRLGRWAAALLGVGMLAFGATTLLANLGGLGGTGWLALTAIPMFAATLGGAIAAAVAVVRDHERGGIVFIPILIGFLLAVFLIGELVAPH